MRKLIIGLLVVALPVTALAAGGHGPKLDEANIDLSNKAALQRGAKYFVNYCMGCHSAKYERYNRMAQDLDLSEDEVIDNLMFTGEKIGQPMTIAMRSEQAVNWFGTKPPDLTLIARSKKNGSDWLYTYMRSFYLDDSRPLGVNNIVFPDVGMPHVMGDLQGWQKAIFKEVTDGQGNVRKEFEGFELVEPGTMTADEYDAAVRDLVAFLTYMAEPVRLERQSLGLWVLMFLAVFFVLAFLMKKEYWKDVH
jgi:ubiquinol-cytochrome c reductase cytochrome c1 subunit